MTHKYPTRAQRQDYKQKTKKKRGGGFRRFIGVILLLIAGVLFALDPIKDYMISRATESNTIGQFSREQILANQNRDATFDFNAIETIDPMTVIGSGVNPNDLPVIGGIAIPAIHMNLPIHKGTDNAGMYYGAGTLYPEQEMGRSNYLLASHHSNNPKLLFAPLMKAELGQKIYLTDLDKVYQYKIDAINTVAPSDGSVLQPTDHAIVTLITCTYDLQNRLIVQGTLEKTVPIKEATKEMQDAFSLKQTIVGNE